MRDTGAVTIEGEAVIAALKRIVLEQRAHGKRHPAVRAAILQARRRSVFGGGTARPARRAAYAA